MNLTQYEQETIINYNDWEASAGIYTHNKALRNKLEKLAQERPDECKLERVSHDGKAMDYTIPKKWIKIRPPRIVNEAQKEALAKERQIAANTAL